MEEKIVNFYFPSNKCKGGLDNQIVNFINPDPITQTRFLYPQANGTDQSKKHKKKHTKKKKKLHHIKKKIKLIKDLSLLA